MSQTPSDNVDAKLKAAEDHLREVMLALPEVTEEFPWGHRTAKVKGKMFAILVLDNDGLGVTTKLPESNEAALTLPFTAPTGYGLGKSGWVSSRFKPGSEVPIGLLAQWIHESFRAVAPQKVLKALMAPGAAQAPKAKSSARAKKPAAAKRAVAVKPAVAGKKPAPGKAAAGGKKSVAKRASAREGSAVRAGAKQTSTAKRGAAGSSRSKR
ncbi:MULTISPECIES: MmcQ/YjbR family DNA-binding protein [Myxococcus]|uniref:MmcQ/YjbR family DNA-binding protein n=1 Tax=Myxococcus TaxID=32 RepID=UPI00112AF7DB|nr:MULTISPECIES: MmcQ/YjbR family DNA-binding protein [Myxococcus]QDF00349.1 DifB protein [Myxococcus xanthus]QDF08127.1 DifB protein [Myxococcus xanthus]WAM25747.1 MmcQ/YjbR family DNA-binding protein [Myxococcus sp. NMCA1]